MNTVLLRPAGAGAPIKVAVKRTSEDGRHYTIIAGEDHADVEVHFSGEGAGWLQLAGRVVPFHARHVGRSLQVWLRGGVYQFEIVDRTARRSGSKSAAAQRSELTAPMPGSIMKILVRPGDSFEAHAPLVIMVSMKMEMTLSEPHPGRVKEVLCEEGELVEMGATLIRLENGD